MDKEEIVRRISAVLHASTNGRGVGLLSTTGDDRQPHATWMGTIACPDLSRVITLTSPDSRKARNVLENPQVEWLFTDGPMNEVLYLRGTARVLDDPEQVEAAWHQMPDKSRAYFLPSEAVGMVFLILETQVQSVELRFPREQQSHYLEPAEVAGVGLHSP